MNKKAFGQFAGRLIALFMAGVLFVGAAGQGLTALVNGVAEFAHQRQKPGHYTERPRPIPVPKNPFRDETREKWWTPKAREAWNDFLFRQRLEDPNFLYAMVTGRGLSFLQGGGYEGGGDVTPGEGSEDTPPAPGSPGGITNTATGNKLSEYPIVSWPGLGQNGVDFTLFHNSITGYAGGVFGKGWSHSYNDFIVYTPGHQAILHRADGLVLPYNEFEGAFIRPIGIYDNLVKNQNGSFTLTTHGQWKQEFSGDGLLTSVRDRNGNVVTIIRDSFGKINTITDSSNPSNRSVTFSYSGGRVSQIADPLGRVWQFSYTGDLLTGITYPQLNSQEHTRTFTYSEFALQVGKCGIASETDLRGKVWRWTYEPALGKLLTEKDPLNNVTSFAYNGSTTTITLPNLQTILHTYNNGSLQSERDEAGFVGSYQYDYNLNITKLTDKRGKEWFYTYDVRGNVLTEKNPLDKIWTNTYSLKNDLLSSKDPLNNLTVYNNDANGNLLTVTDPLAKVVLICLYDGNGQLTSAVNATGETVNLNYNSRGDITQGTNPAGVTKEYAHDLLGNVTSVETSTGATASIDYDEWLRISQTSINSNPVLIYTFDSENNLLEIEGATGATASATYDDVGRSVTMTDPMEGVTTTGYNANGWVVTRTNPRNYTTEFEYTPRGELHKLILPDEIEHRWSYNENGDITSYISPADYTKAFTYDNASRRTGVDYPSGTDTSFSYDIADRLTQMIDASGTYTFSYDASSRETGLSSPQGNITREFDDAGRPTLIDSSIVGEYLLEYDSAGRLSEITNPRNELTSLSYDAHSRLGTRTHANACKEEFSYDTLSRVTGILLKNPAGGTLQSHSYSYDSFGRLSSKTEGGVATSFGYDLAGRTVSEYSAGVSLTYAYDANANRITRTLNNSPSYFSYDEVDRLLTGLGRTYTYDSGGRIAQIQAPGGNTTFSLNFDDRITGITYPNSGANSFSYNGFGARVGEVNSAGSFTYHRDGVFPESPILHDGQKGFTPGVSVQPIGSTTFLHPSLSGFVAQTSTSGVLNGWRGYDSFGNVTGPGGTWMGPYGPNGLPVNPDNGYVGGDNGSFYDPYTGGLIQGELTGITDDGEFAFALQGQNIPDLSDPLLNWSDLFAAWGDKLTGGRTEYIRLLLGVDWVVDKDSDYYKYGSWIGMAHLFFLRGGFRGIIANGVKSRGPNPIPANLPNKSYAPARKLPASKHGRPIPDTQSPHTQLGTRYPKRGNPSYPQHRTWGENGKLEGRIDWTDHGSPGVAGHKIPHFHPWNDKTGWGPGRTLPWLKR